MWDAIKHCTLIYELITTLSIFIYSIYIQPHGSPVGEPKQSSTIVCNTTEILMKRGLTFRAKALC